MVASGDYVTYREMADYVATQTAPIVKAADDHDAWHRGKLEAELSLAHRAKALLFTQICSVAAVGVTILGIIVNHH